MQRTSSKRTDGCESSRRRPRDQPELYEHASAARRWAAAAHNSMQQPASRMEDTGSALSRRTSASDFLCCRVAAPPAFQLLTTNYRPGPQVYEQRERVPSQKQREAAIFSHTYEPHPPRDSWRGTQQAPGWPCRYESNSKEHVAPVRSGGCAALHQQPIIRATAAVASGGAMLRSGQDRIAALRCTHSCAPLVGNATPFELRVCMHAPGRDH